MRTAAGAEPGTKIQLVVVHEQGINVWCGIQKLKFLFSKVH